ncbi:hypothetical protein HZ326_16438 [Fusarium oxysporum f. sp. albedinis]|nr:hypothetical protein HZ326_16438 [Fusarium oxysporum f. sp. albedinis]
MMLTEKSRSVPVSGNGVLAFASVSDVPGKVIVDPGFGPELGLVDDIDLGGEDELDIATSHGSLSYGDVVGGCQPYRARLKSGGYSTWAYQNTVTLNTHYSKKEHLAWKPPTHKLKIHDDQIC